MPPMLQRSRGVRDFRAALTVTWGVLLVASAAAAAAPAYHTHAELSAWINRLAGEHGSACTVESIGTSREGRALWALRLARPGPVEADRRPAMLIAANIDGDHLIGSAVALGIAARLLTSDDEAAIAFLQQHTLYVLPRVNPDAAERFFGDLKSDRRRNLRPDDRDRDGAIDEDPPNDLNGDGLITMMRVYDPETADLMADPDEPRLNVKPDRDKGDRALFKLATEGIDEDADGELNEDDAGGVDLNMNFMHGYKEHADGAGPYQVSEPESLSLLKYVLAHPNIALVLTYGQHDNLSKSPDGKGADNVGAPKTIDAKDVGLYKQIGERFREITGLEEVPSASANGAFFAWAYAHFGVPSFATPLWARPEPKKEEEKEQKEGEQAEKPEAPSQRRGQRAAPPAEAGGEDEASEDLTPSGIGDISQETIDELRAAAEASGFEVTDEMVAQLTPTAVEGFARRMGVKVRRIKTGSGAGGGAKNKEEAAWLAYSDDEQDGAGFVAWQKFDHPELGEVEIGGWVPYFKTNPPPDAIEPIVEKQVEFVLDLAGRFPQVSLSDPQIKRLATNLYEVKTALVNDGYLPTGTAMAVRNRRARPYAVRLGVANEQIVTGQGVHKIWSIPGSGGREPLRWIVAAPDDSAVTITVYSEKFGEFEKSVTLTDSD
ncbi:MAG: M14 family metallopeptidase [Planctomycetota bacterium]